MPIRDPALSDLDLIDDDEAVYAEYSANFAAYNARFSTWAPETFSVIHRNGSTIVAGGRGILNMGALEVRGLWVDDALRGQGYGRRILAAIEAEAINRGARRAMLYTFDWQAQAFYKAAGYTIYSRFEYPDGFQRIDLQKDLV